MPLRTTESGLECPLDKFRLEQGDVVANFGFCNACKFADLTLVSKGEINPVEVCQCPSDMDWDTYRVLMREYAESIIPKRRTPSDFRRFVNVRYQELKPVC